jgi:triphosphoribosyl-dephospho-CoA synthase
MTPGQLAQLACILEATARKPGNVHRFGDYDDAIYLDFILSASALVDPLDRAGRIGVGAAVLEAVEATRRVVATNTNLGMILLLAPLAAVAEGEETRPGLARVLDNLTVDDARLAYRAIRLARPGGLGSAPEQDVAEEPRVPLHQAMRLAADRDSIARQYGTGFRDVFELTLPALRDALATGRPLEPAIITAYLKTLARLPDTLIARKGGLAAALEVSRRAAELVDPALRPLPSALADFDTWLRSRDHVRNPGTTADLTAAALFVALRDGTIELPLPPGSWGRDEVFRSTGP